MQAKLWWPTLLGAQPLQAMQGANHAARALLGACALFTSSLSMDLLFDRWPRLCILRTEAQSAAPAQALVAAGTRWHGTAMSLGQYQTRSQLLCQG